MNVFARYNPADSWRQIQENGVLKMGLDQIRGVAA